MGDQKTTVFHTLLFLLMMALVLTTTVHPIPAADLWWQLAMGRHLVSSGDVARTNFFSYTAFHYPVIDHEWLSELIFFSLYTAGRLPLLYFMKSLVILFSFLLLYETGRLRGASPCFSALAVMVAVSFAKGDLYFDIRPYLFTYLFLALFLFLVERAREKPWSLALLPFMAWAWANCHGGFALYFVLLLLLMAIDATAALLKKGSSVPLIREGAVLLASALLVFINPYGRDLLLYPLSFVKDSFYRRELIEWIRPDLLGRDLPFLVFLVAVAVLAVIFRRRLRLFDGLSLLLFGYLAFTTVRHITLFCLAVVPVLSLLLQELYHALAARIPHSWRDTAVLRSAGGKRFSAIVAMAGLFLAGALLYLRLAAVDYENLSMEKALFPYNGLTFIKYNGLEGPLYNPYEWGGYVLWRLYPPCKVFIDGRANVAYPEEVYRESLDTTAGARGWQEILDRYGVNMVLCNKYHMERGQAYRLGEILGKSAAWGLVYEDRVELLYMRKIPSNEEIFRKAREGALIIPVSAWTLKNSATGLIKEGRLNEAEGLLNDAIALDGSFTSLYVELGYVLMEKGENGKAFQVLRQGLRKDRNLFLAHDLMGVLYEKEGNIEGACREYRRALSINPSFARSREALRRLEGKVRK
ncbi:MAG: hypothetical protein RDV48_14900 [Candidatus Eremiobacteraeota bacterium]|nr:hypothetical protein [Candidatus Eremiobacteraeota bacterium]